MSNPRKFSEKIALHNQKQAEETAAFEQIMREVNTATKPPNNVLSYTQRQHLRINNQAQQLCSYRGGSLPNVNQFVTNSSIDLQNALTNLEDIKQGRDCGDRTCRERTRHPGPHRRAIDKRIDTSPYSSPYLSPPPDSSWRRTNSDSAIHQSTGSNTPGGSGGVSSGSGTIPHMMSPESYSQAATLSPSPPNANCRRDDGLLSVDGCSNSPVLLDGSLGQMYWDPKQQAHVAAPHPNRPKSCEVPGINIYPSEQDPNAIHIPISNNTGSLPDLTNLQFPSPLATPLDVEDQSSNQSPYSTQSGPQQYSPTTSIAFSSQLSPSMVVGSNMMTSMNGVVQTGSQGPGGGGAGGISNQQQQAGAICSSSQQMAQRSSPGAMRRRSPNHGPSNLILDSSVVSSPTSVQACQYRTPPSSAHRNICSPKYGGLVRPSSLKVPDLHSRYLHTAKGITMDMTFDGYQQHQNQGMSSPIYMSSHQQHISQHSPISSIMSPSITMAQSLPTSHMDSYRSNSPRELSAGSCGSAPPSPASQSISPSSSPGVGPAPKNPFNNMAGLSDLSGQQYYQLPPSQIHTSTLQEHFQQFSMMDNDSVGSSTSTSSSGYAQHRPSHQHFHNQTPDGMSNHSPTMMMNNGNYYDQSQLVYHLQDTSQHDGMRSNQHSSVISSNNLTHIVHYTGGDVMTSQAPQTPTSIPDIILTDFSSGHGMEDALSKQDFAKDIGSAMVGLVNMGSAYDSDLFAADELRAELDPIDFDGFQMLTDPEMVADSATEDSFRLDKL